MEQNIYLADNEKFDSDQRAEIEAGLAKDLDVSVYAKQEFLAIQMRQIRLGLEAGLDVSVYAKAEYDWFQMEEIRKGMEAGIDYSLYASPTVSYDKMRQIRKGLQQGVDLSPYVKLSAGILRQFRKALADKVALVEYIKAGYDVEQLEQIRLALVDKLNISPYLVKELRGPSIREISNGLKRGLNPSVYARTEYGWQQMREIRLGMEHRVDINIYANPLFSWQQMREIRLGLEEGIDVSLYRKFIYTASDMERIRKRMIAGESCNIGAAVTEIGENHKIVFHISADEMEARIEIRGNDSGELTSEKIIRELKRAGIVKGILSERIEKLVAEKKYNISMVVAVGKQPKRGKNGYYEFFFNTKPNRKPHILEDGSVDYRNIDWFELVKEGQVIARYHEAENGKDGYTITGRKLPAKKGKEKGILGGRGFTLLPDRRTYVSDITGKIELRDEEEIDISRACILDEVSQVTGNVNFDGSVYVKGDVGNGAVIQATEDVVVNGFVEAAVIQAGGDILLRKGANGAGNGFIEANGKMMCQFLEAINVVSGDNLYANYCLNCNIDVRGGVFISGGKRGIAGGTVQAVRGITTSNVGNKVGIGTTLRLGVDDKVMGEKKELTAMIDEENRELAILENSYLEYQRKYTPEVRNAMEIYMKIENAIYTKQKWLETLYKKQQELDMLIRSSTDAKIVITGTVYEGTVVLIGNAKWKASGVKDVTIQLYNNKITVDSN